MEELRKEYSEDIIIYGNILERFKRLNETDPAGALKLSIDASVGRGEKAALKDRLKEMYDFLQHVSVTARMAWNNAENNLRSNRGE